jgi:hypothetical protein
MLLVGCERVAFLPVTVAVKEFRTSADTIQGESDTL